MVVCRMRGRVVLYRQLVAGLQPFRACNDIRVGRVEDLNAQRVSKGLRSGSHGVLTSDGSHEWLMYSRSLFRSRWLSRPVWTVAYVGSGATVHGGNSSLAKRPNGGRATREMLLVVKAASLMMTSWTSGCEGCTQCGVMGAIATGFRAGCLPVSQRRCVAGDGVWSGLGYTDARGSRVASQCARCDERGSPGISGNREVLMSGWWNESTAHLRFLWPLPRPHISVRLSCPCRISVRPCSATRNLTERAKHPWHLARASGI